MMPEMDGMEATALIRKMGGKQKHLPIVALTANAVHGAREMFLANGFNDFISKPIDSHELVRVLEIWLPPEKIVSKTDPEAGHTRSDKEDKLRRKSILTFVKGNRDTFEKMTQTLYSGDFKTAHRIAHTLKSSAGYLGKKELSAAAASLEASLQAQPPGCTSEQLNTLGELLASALLEFEPLINEAETEKHNAVEIGVDKLTALLSEIKPLLEKGDFGASDYVEKLQRVTGMEELAEKIDDYDFEGALLIVNNIL
jgi:CheY-like chemotaxis protein